MRRNFIWVIGLYVFVFIIIFSTLIILIYVNQTSTVNTEWSELAIQKLISIMELFAGAVIGTLSTAAAFIFSDRSKSQ